MTFRAVIAIESLTRSFGWRDPDDLSIEQVLRTTKVETSI